MTAINSYEIQKIAVESMRDVRSVRKYFRGDSVRPAVASSIIEALEKLGWLHMLPKGEHVPGFTRKMSLTSKEVALLGHDTAKIVEQVAGCLRESGHDPMTIREKMLLTSYTVALVGWVTERLAR